MNKAEFLRQLAEQLADLAPEERDAALEYYTEYLDEAGEAGEADVLRELGSPADVAAAIRDGRQPDGGWAAGYTGNDGSASFGTCYGDDAAPADRTAKTAGRTGAGGETAAGSRQGEAQNAAPDPRQTGAGGAWQTGAPGMGGAGGAGGMDGAPGAPGMGSGLGNWLWLVLLACMLPLAGVLLGVLGALLGILCALLLGGLGVLVTGLVAVVGFAPLLTSAYGNGLLNMGFGLLAAALGALMMAGGVALLTRALPAMGRGLVRAVKTVQRKVRAL